ncbi:MAG: class II aldolase/adducin family protein [Candidatus Aminicenantia bacterium]
MKFHQFLKVGKFLENKGLVLAHGGNMSIREENRIFITKHGTVLSELRRRDIVEIELEGFYNNASMEHPIHQAIYKKTNAKAIIHAHPPYTILLSTLVDKIVPIDEEARILLGEVPILKPKKKVSSDEVAEKASFLLSHSKIFVVESHGTFSIGDSLEEAYFNTLLLENSSKLLFLKMLWKG